MHNSVARRAAVPNSCRQFVNVKKHIMPERSIAIVCIVKLSSRPSSTAGRFHLTKSNFTRQRRISLSYILSDTMIAIRIRNLRPVKKYKKTPTLLGGHFICWHLPIFPGRHQPSIFGTTELNFCVRYGNRWTLSVINTNLLTFVSLLRTVLIILRAAPNVNTFFKKI